MKKQLCIGPCMQKHIAIWELFIKIVVTLMLLLHVMKGGYIDWFHSVVAQITHNLNIL